MSEVSSRVCVRILEEYERCALPIDSLLEGLPLTTEHLRHPSSRIRWDEFTTILRRASERLGGIEALAQFGALQTTDPTARLFRVLTRNVASVRLLYHLGARWSGPSIFRCTEAQCRDLPDGRIEQTLRILPGYRDSDEFFEVVRGALEVAPGLLGLSNSHVEMRREANTGIYLIQPPPPADLLGRLRLMFRRRSKDRLEAQRIYQRALEESLEEKHSSNAELAVKTVRLETLNSLGRKLAEETDPRRLTTEVCTLLVEHCGVEGVELWSGSEPSERLASRFREDRRGGIAVPSAPARARDGAACSETTELSVGSRLVGKLYIFGADDAPAFEQLRSELIPWIALALDNANAFAALQRQNLRIEREAVERQIAEDKFREAQKMDAVGRLAGGLAHDLNNALTVIAGFAELIRMQLPDDHAAQRDIDAILDEGERSAHTIKQLLAFSRASDISVEPLDLDLVLSDMERLLAQLVGADTRVEILTELGHHEIDADRGQIEQLIVNLVSNALDAMPEGGQITIRTESYHDTDGAWVRLRIRDSGIGMDEKTRNAMFEPFFTTKARGEGTGLGLAAVYGIVVEREGRIDVDTRPGEGTEIRIDFPASERREEARAAFSPRPDDLAGSETILIVDDDDRVRSILRRNLEAKGYVVYEAADGAEALGVAETLVPAIDLVVTDIVMPGMDGRELGRRLMDLDPDLRGIIYVSGYAPQIVEGLESLGKRSKFLHKPFSTDVLLESARSLLDA